MKGTDHPAERAGGAHPTGAADGETYDRDLDVRAILWSAAYLAGGVVFVCLLMWWLFLGLRRLEARADPAPPPLAEERGPQAPPPGPRLQASPDQDMIDLRAGEDRALHQPAWIDPKQGIVRLPIDLAMDVVARRGLPAAGAAATQPSPSGVTVPKPPAGENP